MSPENVWNPDSDPLTAVTNKRCSKSTKTECGHEPGEAEGEEKPLELLPHCPRHPSSSRGAARGHGMQMHLLFPTCPCDLTNHRLSSALLESSRSSPQSDILPVGHRSSSVASPCLAEAIHPCWNTWPISAEGMRPARKWIANRLVCLASNLGWYMSSDVKQMELWLTHFTSSSEGGYQRSLELLLHNL